MKKLIILSAMMLMFYGCRTTGTETYIDRTTGQIGMETKYVNFPSLEKVCVVTPGESLIASLPTHKGIKLLETVNHNAEHNGFTNTFILEAGNLPMMGTNGTGTFYGDKNKVRQIVVGSNQLVDGGIFIPNNETINHSLFIDNVTSVMNLLDKKVNYEKIDIVSANENDFKQDLIYTGKSGNNINIEYREFKGNIARPAFSQSLTYDISKDNVIGFRGALFKVFEATNSSIKYKVIKHIKN